MAHGGGRTPPSFPDPAPPPASPSSGHYLLQLLQKPPSASSAFPPTPTPPSDSISSHHHDPAVAAVGPSHHFPSWPNNDPPPPAPHSLLPPSPFPFLPPHSFSNLPWPVATFPPPPFDFHNSHFPTTPAAFFPDAHAHAHAHQLGFSPPSADFGNAVHQRPTLPSLQQQRFHQDQGAAASLDNTLTFGSLKCELWNQHGLPNGSSAAMGPPKTHQKLGSEQSGSSFASAKSSSVPDSAHASQDKGMASPWLKQHRGTPLWPPAEPRKLKDPGQWGNLNHERQDGNRGGGSVQRKGVRNNISRGNARLDVPLSAQIDDPGPPSGSGLHSVPAVDIDESLAQLHFEGAGKHEPALKRLDIMSDQGGDVLTKQLNAHLVIKDEFRGRNSVRQHNGSYKKDLRSSFPRGQPGPNHRGRNRRKEIMCRRDIENFTPSFLSIYESLIPAEEEKAKQKQLLALLEKLVNKEWPKAQLYLYGSCANSFGVSNSDIDVCLAIDNDGITKSDILLKLAEILESDNLQNVQALTRARVPIVKLMDPVTEISCDICINNVLAVVNTRLLRDYAQIDARLQQLAFIVKHWAKSRRVNETYRGTLSSYAYVLMCIHFLQQRRPAILPCLQELNATYTVTVDDIECSYFDQVEDLRDYGSINKESLARLLWAFFDYWAYRHDYANDVISVRTGSILSKRAKEWTTRVGNDRHLICIEDPFEVNHDLGRVVDKYSIQILRDEFERAAYILQYDPNPSVTLFEPYIDAE